MKTKSFKPKILLIAASLFLQVENIKAQQVSIATGNTVTGTGGSVSYSVGQIVYTTASGINGSTAQGIQQAFEISTVLGIEETAIHLEMLAYPNPTNDYLILTNNTKVLLELSYELIDSNGKILENRLMKNPTETIVMIGLPVATYFIKVKNNGIVVKVFKIIKI